MAVACLAEEMRVSMGDGIHAGTGKPDACPRRHQTCHSRKRATSVPAEGPAYGLDLTRHCVVPLQALQAQKEVACSQKPHVWCRLNF